MVATASKNCIAIAIYTRLSKELMTIDEISKEFSKIDLTLLVISGLETYLQTSEVSIVNIQKSIDKFQDKNVQA